MRYRSGGTNQIAGYVVGVTIEVDCNRGVACNYHAVAVCVFRQNYRSVGGCCRNCFLQSVETFLTYRCNNFCHCNTVVQTVCFLAKNGAVRQVGCVAKSIQSATDNGNVRAGNCADNNAVCDFNRAAFGRYNVAVDCYRVNGKRAACSNRAVNCAVCNCKSTCVCKRTVNSVSAKFKRYVSACRNCNIFRNVDKQSCRFAVCRFNCRLQRYVADAVYRCNVGACFYNILAVYNVGGIDYETVCHVLSFGNYRERTAADCCNGFVCCVNDCAVNRACFDFQTLRCACGRCRGTDFNVTVDCSGEAFVQRYVNVVVVRHPVANVKCVFASCSIDYRVARDYRVAKVVGNNVTCVGRGQDHAVQSEVTVVLDEYFCAVGSQRTIFQSNVAIAK